MLEIEIKVINRHQNKNYKPDDVFMENGMLVERAFGNVTELSKEVFDDMLKAKRCEHLKRVSV